MIKRKRMHINAPALMRLILRVLDQARGHEAVGFPSLGLIPALRFNSATSFLIAASWQHVKVSHISGDQQTLTTLHMSRHFCRTLQRWKTVPFQQHDSIQVEHHEKRQ